MEYVIVGCGLTGAVIARELAEAGQKVTIWERRNHIAGNLFDEYDEHGVLVHRYGPHTFHTKKKELYDYISRFEEWVPYHLNCGAVFDGKYTPTPFNFQTIDLFYPKADAEKLKNHLSVYFQNRESVSVLEALASDDTAVREYAEFLFEKDYRPYSAKQWGIEPDQVDPSVLARVPLRLSYRTGYFDDKYQFMPKHSYVRFFTALLDHPSISIQLNIDAMSRIGFENNKLTMDGKTAPSTVVVYSGALDELFRFSFGKLPYRSLRFEWKYEEVDSFQAAPVVAYPQANGYTRIAEYKKMTNQLVQGTSYSLEYPLAYRQGEANEPYYPLLTQESIHHYQEYNSLKDQIPNLYCCGRLADFKYYNMDEALDRALIVSKKILQDNIRI